MIHLIQQKATRSQIDEMLEELINIRPHQQSLSMESQGPAIKQQVETIVRKLWRLYEKTWQSAVPAIYKILRQ